MRRRFVGNRRRARRPRDGVSGGGVPLVASRRAGPEHEDVPGAGRRRRRRDVRAAGVRPELGFRDGRVLARDADGRRAAFQPGREHRVVLRQPGQEPDQPRGGSTRRRRHVVPGPRQRRARRRERRPRRGGDRGSRPGGRLVPVEQRGEHARDVAAPEDADGDFRRRRVLAQLGVRGGLLRVRQRQRPGRAALGVGRARARRRGAGPLPRDGCLRFNEMGVGRGGGRRGDWLVRQRDGRRDLDRRHGGGRLGGLGRAAVRARVRGPLRRTRHVRRVRGRGGRRLRVVRVRGAVSGARGGERLPGDGGRRRGVPGGVRRRRLLRGVRAEAGLRLVPQHRRVPRRGRRRADGEGWRRRVRGFRFRRGGGVNVPHARGGGDVRGV